VPGPPSVPADSAAPRWVVVLAAGASRRFEGRPKALLDLRGESAVERVLRVARSAGIGSAVVVVGPHHALIEAALGSDPAVIAVNERWEDGRTGSIQLGLRTAGPDANVLLWPVDHPFVSANTVRNLAEAARGDPLAAWVMPTHEGRGGHPVWLAPAASRLAQRLAPDAPFRGLIPRLGVQVLRVPTQDPWILVGTDTPTEYRRALLDWRRGD
jgi:molybdenum cofactor cytidylyltransferase